MAKSERKFTKAMVVAVGALGLISTGLLVNDPMTTADASMSPSVFELNSSRLSQRNLASADEGSSDAAPTSEALMSQGMVELKCQDDSQTLETSQLRLRLRGDNCLTENSASTSIKNSSNGYIATVFHKPDFSFTTDYINLSEGKNEIDISFETAEGAVTNHKLTINRLPASIKK